MWAKIQISFFCCNCFLSHLSITFLFFTSFFLSSVCVCCSRLVRLNASVFLFFLSSFSSFSSYFIETPKMVTKQWITPQNRTFTKADTKIRSQCSNSPFRSQLLANPISQQKAIEFLSNFCSLDFSIFLSLFFVLYFLFGRLSSSCHGFICSANVSSNIQIVCVCHTFAFWVYECVAFFKSLILFLWCQHTKWRWMFSMWTKRE